MTNDVDTDSALQAMKFCFVVFNFAFQAVPDSAKFVVAFDCCCQSISSGGEILHMREQVDFGRPNRWPLPSVVACLI